jgi:hypothetical protein
MKDSAIRFCRNFPRRNYDLSEKSLPFPVIREPNGDTNDDVLHVTLIYTGYQHLIYLYYLYRVLNNMVIRYHSLCYYL